MRQTDTHVIIDVQRNGQRTTVSLPRPVFWLDALTRPGGAQATEEIVQARASEGKDSKNLVAALGWRALQAVERLMTDFERRTGDSAMPIVSGEIERERLLRVMRHVANLPDDAELPGPFPDLSNVDVQS